MAEIWHNPRCSKSRAALALLKERGHDPNIVLYLDAPPTEQRLREVIDQLGGDAFALVRTKEAAFKEQGLSKASPSEDLIAAMVAHPSLIERPLVITERGTRIGRPTEALEDIL